MTARQRESDELTLAWVRERAAGVTVKELSRRYRVTEQRISVATNRILDADRAESGEDAEGFYWKPARR